MKIKNTNKPGWTSMQGKVQCPKMRMGHTSNHNARSLSFAHLPSGSWGPRKVTRGSGPLQLSGEFASIFFLGKSEAMADRSYPPPEVIRGHNRSYDVEGRYRNFYAGLEGFPELVSTGEGWCQERVMRHAQSFSNGCDSNLVPSQPIWAQFSAMRVGARYV